MKVFQHIATFTYPSDLLIARSLLESMNIACNVKDELTVQVHNFYSNAIGGITLEVATEKYDVAKSLLLERGFESYLVDTVEGTSEPKDTIEKTSFIKRSMSFLLIGIFALIVIALVLVINF